eukprot:maker-scaffold_4-snap-gene-3.4-mRNA-1 protein AED:0.04 eAED:0.04 QI:0/1/0/1/0/0/2/127/358
MILKLPFIAKQFPSTSYTVQTEPKDPSPSFSAWWYFLYSIAESVVMPYPGLVKTSIGHYHGKIMRQRFSRENDSTDANTSSSVQEAQQQEFNPGSIMIYGISSFAKSYKKTTACYLIGLVVLLFATGFAVSPETELKYAEILDNIDYTQLRRFEKNMIKFENEYQRVKGWIVCDAKCVKADNNRRHARRNLKREMARIDAIKSEGKRQLGVFSTYGVDEARDLFWGLFNKGRGFAQDQTYFDVILHTIHSVGSDESWLSVLIQVLLSMIFNFTVGMIGTLVTFVYYLYYMIETYQPGYILGILFFGLGVAGAFALVVSFLLGLYFGTAGTAYVAFQAAGPNIRIGTGRPRRRIGRRFF